MHRTSIAAAFSFGLAMAWAAAAANAGESVPAQRGDGPASPACGQALALLQAQEANVLEARQHGPRVSGAGAGAGPASAPALAAARLQAARQHAARACLGAGGDAAPAVQRQVQPAITVAPVAAPPVATAVPALTPPLPRIRLSPPATVLTSCDGGGCWASDGTRLNRVGTQLVGPRGACQAHGTLLSCP